MRRYSVPQLVARLRAHTASRPSPLDPDMAGWAIRTTRAICARLEGNAGRRCLKESLLLFYWLPKFGIRPKIHFGIQKTEQGNLKGHAWISLPDGTTLGKGALEKYREILSFE